MVNILDITDASIMMWSLTGCASRGVMLYEMTYARETQIRMSRSAEKPTLVTVPSSEDCKKVLLQWVDRKHHGGVCTVCY
jgi:hypothetical protein